jgi:PadR family transcriptional regulator PadR
MIKNRNSFKMGTVEMLVLYLLRQKDLYGYEISSLLDKLSDGKYQLAEGSLYPILYRLLEKHYISDKEVPIGRRRVRVYYHIEESGRSRLKDLLQDYQEIAQGINLILTSKLDEIEGERQSHD